MNEAYMNKCFKCGAELELWNGVYYCSRVRTCYYAWNKHPKN